MNRWLVAFWIVFTAFILAAAIVKGRISPQMALSDILNSIFAVIAIAIAGATHWDARHAGAEQGKALEASRVALGDVVVTLKTQTDLLAEQNQIAREEANRALKERERKPDIELSLGSMSWKAIKEAIVNKTPVTITRSFAKKMSIDLINVGNKVLETPLVRISATPSSITVINPTNVRLTPPNRLDYFGPSIPNIPPVANVKNPFGFNYSMTIPDTVTSIELYVRVGGSNMESREFTIPLTVTPD